jgi:hypothetical protein
VRSPRLYLFEHLRQKQHLLWRRELISRASS